MNCLFFWWLPVLLSLLVLFPPPKIFFPPFSFTFFFFLASLELERAANPFPDEEYFIIVWSELGKEKKSSQIRVERGIDTNQKEKEREAVDVLR
jgi:hypothetical protein